MQHAMIFIGALREKILNELIKGSFRSLISRFILRIVNRHVFTGYQRMEPFFFVVDVLVDLLRPAAERRLACAGDRIMAFFEPVIVAETFAAFRAPFAALEMYGPDMLADFEGLVSTLCSTRENNDKTRVLTTHVQQACTFFRRTRSTPAGRVRSMGNSV